MKKLLLPLLLITSVWVQAQNVSATLLGRYTNGEEGACEISAYDGPSKRLFITNAAADAVDIVDISDPTQPLLKKSIDIASYGGGVNSVASLKNGHIAVAIEAEVKQDSGKVVFFNTDGEFVSSVTVGALPDMVTVTPDGKKVLVANEGEPNKDYDNDPEGTLSIIDISGGMAGLGQEKVKNLHFDTAPDTIMGSVRKPGTPYKQDLEPEYIAVSPTGGVAAVVCQESNVFVFVDLEKDSITSYKGLGFKDHAQAGSGFDASDKDGAITIQTHQVKGVYQPDAIASYMVDGKTYWLSANEGDARDYKGYSSETRVSKLKLDKTAFPNAESLQAETALGRLKTFTPDVLGDTDGDGDVDELYSYGARSFSIWDSEGNLVWDSGDDFERYIAENHPDFFNCNDGLAEDKDKRSDDKGPEPEAITIGKIANRYYAFIGMERQGGVMIYDISDPSQPHFEMYVDTFQEDGTMTDIAPEGLVFVPSDQGPTGKDLLIVSNEVSGTTAIYQIDDELVSGWRGESEPSRFNIVPSQNPTGSELEVNITGMEVGHKTFIYTLMDIRGQVVRSGKWKAGIQRLDMKQVPQGFYYLSVSSGSLNWTEKIIRE